MLNGVTNILFQTSNDGLCLNVATLNIKNDTLKSAESS